ncbi:SpaA isopeptide-forming pilin-related protein [Lacticaseibacillus mingshuiensis]|uniref:SpaA isopeptide-forming pilin-related protein n=1 Tax=Lacticaseibacillus mingshuiensis TaxID=2799574 RepID=A0ABW4CJM7_9LACO|nr:SpaA isopeptide-forming pilin-related protein [Lacticaseibacillus mingshuiensis]
MTETKDRHTNIVMRLTRILCVSVVLLGQVLVMPAAKTAKADGSALAQPAGTYAETYPSTQYDILGAAQHFSLVGRDKVTLGSSQDGNVATKDLAATSDWHTADDLGPLPVNATTGKGTDVNYFQTIDDINGFSASAFGSASKQVVVGADTTVGLASQNQGETTLTLDGKKMDALHIGDVSQESADQPFIDLDQTFQQLETVSNLFAGKGKTYQKTNDNELDIDVDPEADNSQWPLMYPLQLTKVDENGQPITSGVKFQLVQKDDDGQLTPVDISKVTVFDSQNNRLDKNVLTTDKNGQLNISVSAPGTYYFVELPRDQQAADYNYAVNAAPSDEFTTGVMPDAAYVNLTWEQLAGEKGEAKSAINFSGINFDDSNSRPIIINVDFSNYDGSKISAGDAGNISFEGLTDADLKDFNRAKILWNFYGYKDGQTISICNDTFYGSILAPDANLVVQSAHVFGSIIGRTVAVSGDTNHRWDLNFSAYTGENTGTVENTQFAQATVKKVWHLGDPADQQNAEATVQLYQVADGTSQTKDQPVGDPVTLNAANDFTATFTKLSPTAKYVVKEVGATVNGQSTGKEFSTTLTGDLDGNGDLDFTSTTDPQVTLTNTQHVIDVRKVATGAKAGDTPLAGATFKLDQITTAEDGSETKTPVATITDANQTQPLAPGVYEITETVAPTGYSLDATPARFELTTDYQWQQLSQNADKKWVPSALPTQTPSIYDKDSFYVSSSGESTAGNVLHFIKTDTPSWQLNVLKQDEATGKPLAGAIFTLYPKGQPDKAITSAPTDANGHVQFSQALDRGTTYELVEKTAPDGYDVDATPREISFGNASQDPALTVDADASTTMTYAFTDKRTTVIFHLNKVDHWNHKTQLTGAQFSLQDTTSDAAPAVLKSENVAGQKWNMTAMGLQAGHTYTLTETAAPTGYLRGTGSYTIKVKLDGTVEFYAPGDKTAQDLAKTDGIATITNMPQTILPHTGGGGVSRYLVMALAMFALAGFLILIVAAFRREVRHE